MRVYYSCCKGKMVYSEEGPHHAGRDRVAHDAVRFLRRSAHGQAAGVWDNSRRADAALRDTEARLGLVRRFAAQRAAAAALEDTLTKLRDTVGGDARLLAERALRQLQDLKG